MYLILSDADDGLCVNLRQALEKRGAQVRVVPDPFCESIRFSWRINSAGTSSTLAFADGTCLCDRDISGVFIRRRRALITSTSSDDYCYIQAEIEAASFGWIWTLQCPVVNRLPPWLWYSRKPSVQFWSRLLRRNGLPEVECCAPRSDSGSKNWDESRALDVGDPAICYGHACIVGRSVVWNIDRSESLHPYESALLDLTRYVGLSFLEVAFVETSEGIAIKEVDPFPDLSRFDESSTCAITEALATLFADSNHQSGPQ
jgi:hypothetical protein